VRGYLLVGLLIVGACGRRGFEPDPPGSGRGDGGGGDDDAPRADAATSCGPDGAVCAWSTGEFGACSDSCTTGTQTRTVECHDASGGLAVDELCDAASRPAATQACAETACDWTMSAWGGCTVNCGGGAQTRTVECQASSGIIVTDGYCTTSKPAVMQTCNTQACCVDLNNTIHELPKDGLQACTDLRYFATNDATSPTRRCTELGYATFGNYVLEFTNAQWCMYCNARTKTWNGSAWVTNGCTNPVNVLRCCNLP
jgi:hypothetical protein